VSAIGTGCWGSAYRSPLTAYLLIGYLLTGTSLVGQTPLAARWDHVHLRHDAQSYAFSLHLSDTSTIVSVEVETAWRLTGRGPVVLDLDSTWAIGKAEVNGRAVRWRREGNRVVIPVAGRAGTTVTTRVQYAGTPTDGLVVRSAGADRTIFADNWPDRARHWLASQDHPADKASVSWTIDAPPGFTVVANGRLEGVDSSSAGRAVWRFLNPEPIPVYTMVIGMARLAVTKLPPAGCPSRCVPVSVITYPADSAFAVDGPFRNASAMVEFFSNRIAPFPYAELRHVESSTRFGGMENATVIFYDEKGYRARRTREETVAHETAHQWFGDAVTEADWHHLWLSEGFASYGAALWDERQGGDSALRATMRTARATVLASAITERPILDSAVTDRMRLLNSNNYQKGAWVLHSLRGLMGDSGFFRGLTRYYLAFAHRNALSSDFARVMAETAGQDLGWFFRQSLTQPGYPVFEVATEVEGGHLVLTLRQVQKKAWGSYRIPNLRVRLDDRVLTVDVTGPTTQIATHWAGDLAPRVVEIDPDGWWLLSVRGEK